VFHFQRFVFILLTALVLLVSSACRQEPVKTAGPPPATPVSVASASLESVPTELRVVGTVEASAVVQIKSQIAGQLERVAFTEGQNIAKGDLLFVIDSRPYQEALRQAEAAVARDRAQINQAEAAVARDTAQAQFAASDAAACGKSRQGQ
jgi:multidrug efflux system membrane fusion protein